MRHKNKAILADGGYKYHEQFSGKISQILLGKEKDVCLYYGDGGGGYINLDTTK